MQHRIIHRFSPTTFQASLSHHAQDADAVTAELEALGIDAICRQYAADYRDEAIEALAATCDEPTVEFVALEQMTMLCAKRAGV